MTWCRKEVFVNLSMNQLADESIRQLDDEPIRQWADELMSQLDN